MLKIKSPIKLKCQTSMVTMHSDLSEKISANYSLMNNRIRKEELLYVTTQTPEVYFAEGNNISILNNVNNTSNQELNLDVINNLVNRIIVSGTDNFTYQDSVYISNVLRKIGITDVSNFMKQVHLLQEEKNENNKLIKVYESQKNVLFNLIQTQIDENIENHVKNEENKYDTNKYYIHEEIYNRLKTGDIYEEVHNHSQGIESVTNRIFKNEMAISEQQLLIQNFRLNNLKNQIMYKNEPLYYYHTNTYEMDDEGEKIEVKPEEKISSAILLNLVDQIYSLRVNEIQKNSHNWYSVAGALFKTADNTWKRYESYHNEGKRLNANIYNTLKEINNSKKNEQIIVNNIIKEFKSINEEHLVYKQLDEINEITEGEYNHYNNQTVVEAGDTSQNQYVSELQNIINNTNIITNNNEQSVQEFLNFVHYDNNDEEEHNLVDIQSHITESELEKINQKNIENYKKLLEIERQRPKVTNRVVNKEKARKDILRAMENPGEVINEYLNNNETDIHEEINLSLNQEIYDLFSDETKAIFNQLYQQNNIGIPRQEMPMEIVYPQMSEEMTQEDELVQYNERVITQDNIVKNEKVVTQILQSPTVKYEINEVINNRIEELKNNTVNNLYEKYFGPEDVVHNAKQIQDKEVSSQEEEKQKAQLELTHFMNEALLEDKVVHNISTYRTTTQNSVGLIHKEEEQIITEELFDTIKKQAVDTVREETIENKEVHNVVSNERVFNETVNRFNYNTQENIEELVQKNVKKQINTISEQVYGKIEKKLQHERKRRGY